jgi:DNA helicase IV
MAAPDLDDEQAYIDRAYVQLQRMRVRADELLASMKGVDLDLDWALARRVRALADNPRALCFGRIDEEEGATWYIGRRHVEDEEGEPVVLEWRAPIALPFYRASWKDPMGLSRRRQFIVDGRTLLSIGDDRFGTDIAPPSREELGVRGREALLVELERARSGEMLDIVATIQPEQDEVIRAPAGGILVVQGGPGSGKTAVGLHRAAFLLYGNEAMIRANVLVVGPNRTFLRYIAQVLPSLGEHAVIQTTLADLVPETATSGDPEPAGVEKLKGDGRMAAVLARAIGARRHVDPTDLEVTIGLRRIAIPADEVNALMASTAQRRLPYARGRDVLRDQLVAALTARYVDAAGLPPDGSGLGRELRRQRALREALDRRWPSVSAPSLVADLLSNRRRLADAADGILSPDEQRLVLRRRGRAWAAADGPLVDEAKDLITGQSRTYGHVIADEAQDLSPMQLQMLARRCPAGSMTLLGDLAQGIGVWAHEEWRQLVKWLPREGGTRIVELRHGYRSPSQVLTLASRLLPVAAPQVAPTEAVRPGRTNPVRIVAPPDGLLRAVSAEVHRLAAAYATVAVIVPASLAEAVSGEVTAAGVDAGRAERDGLSRPVTVVPATGAKGLEFDAVVVVEPASIAAELETVERGLRLLYVALTRPTQHLSIITSTALPAALAS